MTFRVGVLYGLRRSETLALRWNDVDVAAGTLRIDEGLIAVKHGAVWSDPKNARSRRLIPLDPGTLQAFERRRDEQPVERLLAGDGWDEQDLVITTRHGRS